MNEEQDLLRSKVTICVYFSPETEGETHVFGDVVRAVITVRILVFTRKTEKRNGLRVKVGIISVIQHLIIILNQDGIKEFKDWREHAVIWCSCGLTIFEFYWQNRLRERKNRCRFCSSCDT